MIGKFKISYDNNYLILTPEIRIYNQPKTLTSEADIKSTIYADNFLVFNVLKNDIGFEMSGFDALPGGGKSYDAVTSDNLNRSALFIIGN